MATLPTPGGDSGTWGTELNEFLVGTGDNVAFYVNGTAYHQGVLHGTAAAPVTAGSGPTFKVARTEAVTEASMPSGIGANNQGNAAIWGNSSGRAASEAQAVGVLATAASVSTQSAHNDDACGLSAMGAIQGSGTGVGIGAYIEGRRDTLTAGATGLEVACRNYTAGNTSYNSAGFSTTSGIWLVNRASNGATQNAVGLSFGNPDSVKWDVGIGFPAQNGGAIVNASIRDDSNAATSILINGTHATAAISIADGAGNVMFGTSPVTLSSSGSALALTLPDAVQTVPSRVVLSSTMYNAAEDTIYSPVRINGTARGAVGIEERMIPLHIHVKDSLAVTETAVTGATNATPIVITATAHGYTTGDRVVVYGVGGNTAANGAWAVTVLTANTVSLDGSVGSGAYTSGGTITNRSGYLGVHVDVVTRFARGGMTGTGFSGDDVAGFSVQNAGTAKATDAFYLADSPAIVGNAWETSISLDGNSKKGIQMGATYSTGGIDLGLSTCTSYAIRLPHNTPMKAVLAGGTDAEMFRLNTSDRLQFSMTMQWADTANVVLSSGTGSQLGTTAAQKLGLWGATPVIQPATTGTATGFTAGGGTTVTDASTFTGGVGSKAYRISDIVLACKQAGIMAAS